MPLWKRKGDSKAETMLGEAPNLGPIVKLQSTSIF